MARSEPATRAEIAESLEQDFGLGGQFIYLLDAIPLVEMLWADGICQPEERALVEKFLEEHAARLSRDAGGQQVLTAADRHAFLARFVDRRPPPRQLQALVELAAALLRSGGSSAMEQRQRVVDYCVDIAAAAVPHYPYGHHERFESAEKSRLYQLLRTLDMPTL